ncbi:helix-turn-helix transcriptional regulator [Sphingomonas colocasiae]|uniref:Helix-turn-helix transcriptional regulator n=1 Tax=Sphingomonas colocasiae TaxID=1848973 RepID=A0ABS7PVE8_9SPHN|nr:helix-turn-helix transcriptional regulator [Sphingomonas colocasiae]MBY8825253.1 helix-turn-helix transcriptional regulator [Sphingomonas colocasiae]
MTHTAIEAPSPSSLHRLVRPQCRRDAGLASAATPRSVHRADHVMDMPFADAGTRMEQDRNETGLAAAAEAGARLIDAIATPDGFGALCAELGAICAFQNFIVYVFRADASPALIHSNRGMPRMQDSMAGYIHGLYALDPFHRLTLEGASGLFRMRDIMPEAFPQSEYHRRFYKFTDVSDELRYIVQPDAARTVHIFIEREGGALFSAAEMARLHAVAPFVLRFVAAHIAWADQGEPERLAPAPAFDLREKVRAMQPGALTPREVDTVELMLKGHSTKSMARVLGIDAGTVANHKRHIYAKLDVHSQAQLFDLFLRSLAA